MTCSPDWAEKRFNAVKASPAGMSKFRFAPLARGNVSREASAARTHGPATPARSQSHNTMQGLSANRRDRDGVTFAIITLPPAARRRTTPGSTVGAEESAKRFFAER